MCWSTISVLMVGIYRTHAALEAAWKYFILGSVGICVLRCSYHPLLTWRAFCFGRGRRP
jgi:NADH:ubiquinone oxidoreductase subunit 2 (subunit N)